MRKALHTKDVNFFPSLNCSNHKFIPQNQKFLSNKENFPELRYMISDSTTDDLFSKESTDNEDFEDIFLNKCYKSKNEKIINDEFQKKNNIDETKYKTEMCKNWEEKGRCNYGKKCKFAHGKKELIDKAFVNKERYKSKFCNSFHTMHYCLYGNRCLFIHNQSKNHEEIFKKNYYKMNLNSLDFNDIISETKPKKRCEFFSKMANKNQLEIDKIQEKYCRNLLEDE